MKYSKKHLVHLWHISLGIFAFTALCAMAGAGDLYILEPVAMDVSPSADSVEPAGISGPGESLIHLIRGSFDPLREDETLSKIRPESLTTGRASVIQDEPFILQFTGAVREEWKTALAEKGVRFYDYIPQNAFCVKFNGDGDALKEEFPFVRAIIPYRPWYRIEGNVLFDYLSSGDGQKEITFTKSGQDKQVIEKTILSEETAASAEYIICCFPDSDLSGLMNTLEGCGGKILDTSRSPLKIKLRVRMTPAGIGDLARNPVVSWMERAPEWELFNNKAGVAGILDVHPVWRDWGLYGSGQIVGVADSGLDNGSTSPDQLHDDFENGSGVSRVAQIFDRVGDTGADNNGHGSHVAGSVTGNGIKSGSNPAAHSYPDTSTTGMAPEATLVFQALMKNDDGSLAGIPTDLNTLFSEARGAGVRVHTNSWGSNAAGAYTAQCQDVDEYMWNNSDFTILYSAGNAGKDLGAPLGVIDPMSMGAPAASKNCITVGASENNRPDTGNANPYGTMWPNDFPSEPIKSDPMSNNAGGMVAFSSRGPCMDGRYKPDICAPGTNILSTRSTQAPDQSFWTTHNAFYGYMGGTSMATPLVCGMTVLMREYLVTRKGITSPPAALVKAMMLNGAKELNPGQHGTGAYREITKNAPNDVEGWGRASLEGALPKGNRNVLVNYRSPGIATAEQLDYQFRVLGNDLPVRLKMVWTDYPGNPATNGGLVNDLDFDLVKPDSAVVTPLNPRSPGFIQYYSNNGELNNFAQPSKMYDGYAVKFTPAVTPFSPIAVNFLCASAISGLSYMDVFILADNGGFPGTILWQALAVPVDFQAYNGQYYLAICSVQPLGLNLTGTFYVGVQWSYSANVYIAASTVSPRTGNDFYFVYDYFGNHQWQAWSFDSTADLGMEVLGTGPESTSSRDGVNNVEGIELQSPPTGLYTIRVKGTNVPQGPQPFALVISGNVSPPTTPTPTPTPVPNACGDADDDGEITPGDAQWAFECQAGQKTGDDCNPLWLDVNCSGGVTTEDATRIFQKYINNTALSCCP